MSHNGSHNALMCFALLDPANPGTTGETLATLTHALQGSEHKLNLVLNKADSFTRMNDFARAYGALCWNLSKVIERKDLPRIYTMCIPVQEVDGDGADSNRECLAARYCE